MNEHIPLISDRVYVETGSEDVIYLNAGEKRVSLRQIEQRFVGAGAFQLGGINRTLIIRPTSAAR